MEIEPGIHQLTIGREPFQGFPPPNSFIVAGTDATIMIDAGWDDPQDNEARLAYLRDLGGPPLTEIIITHKHPDHGGGAAHLHHATGASLSCHPLDRQAIESERLQGKAPIATDLVGGETRELGGISLQVLHAPGHTHGCLALYVPETGALFATDTVMGMSTTVIRPDEGSLTDYAKTLDVFERIAPAKIYSGHGAPVTNPVARIRKLIEHRAEREQQLLEALAGGPHTVSALRQTIYHGLPESRHMLAEQQLTTGLRKLADDGTARGDGDRWGLA
jgi:glyoxylase-like metal-dependent hydrolase (beta-lactamase superfamily II)